jgi:glycosyltransferase involved in cell wall biosynthesis
MPLILAEFPDAHIYIAGGNTVYPASIKQKLLDTGYNVYLRQLIQEYNLKGKITFLGALSSDEMCATYLKSNVFVLCSAIENSSNALAEAQCVGIPTVATSVAGNPTMTQNGKLSLQYNFEDYIQLAENIIKVFSGKYNVDMFSNGETAMRYFTEHIDRDAIYLLDEPENSLSIKFQLDLAKYISDSARHFGCQFIISTHSPILLSLEGAKIYDLDSNPVRTCEWTELENVRAYYNFFKQHENNF